MSTTITTYDDRETFYDEADEAQFALLDGEFQWWLVWGGEDGEWYGVRPFSGSDGPRDDSPDAYRPVGPENLDGIRLPWRVANIDRAIREATR